MLCHPHCFLSFLTLSFPIVPTVSRAYTLCGCVHVGCDLHKPAYSGGCQAPREVPPQTSRASRKVQIAWASLVLSDSSLVIPLKLLLPPLFSLDANQPTASCLLGADSISQGAHLLQGPFIKSTGAAADLSQSRAGGGGELSGGGRGILGVGV